MPPAVTEVQRFLSARRGSMNVEEPGPIRAVGGNAMSGTTAASQDDQLLGYYRRAAAMTSAGRHAALLDGLPGDVGELAAIAQGLLIHEHIAPAYGVTLSDERRASVHVRPVERLLGQIVTEDDAPLTTARPAELRLPGNCRHFSVLMVAFLRAQGVPARARCGFGGYFGGGVFEDHWVCEYWNAGQRRWILVDAQIDAIQRGMFEIDFDLLDVPRDRFLVAGDAWARCRAGEDDPGRFGLSFMKEAGYWWIAGNQMRDVAALNNVELLPWDVWGAMPKPGEVIDDGRLALFDRLAELTAAPDANVPFGELGALYRQDERINVGGSVLNVLLGREEEV
jgi:hypothetical protein